MALEASFGEVRLQVMQADITKLAVDAIVNAANENLLPGGGVCGAIHDAAGPELAADCWALRRCAVGDAKITPGHRLPAKYVIHAVGPVWHGGKENEPELLRACYVRALEIAQEHGLSSIAFPAISTGIFGYPHSPAAAIAVEAVLATLPACPSIKEVIFACFTAESERAIEMALTQTAAQGK